jgi:hypothetical protein
MLPQIQPEIQIADEVAEESPQEESPKTIFSAHLRAKSMVEPNKINPPVRPAPRRSLMLQNKTVLPPKPEKGPNYKKFKHMRIKFFGEQPDNRGFQEDLTFLNVKYTVYNDGKIQGEIPKYHVISLYSVRYDKNNREICISVISFIFGKIICTFKFFYLIPTRENKRKNN